MLADPHYRAREAIIRMAHPEFGDFPMHNVFPKLSETPGEVRTLGPALGRHNAEIYGGLGLTPEQIAALETAGTI
ncbi:CoA transferase [Actinomadura madurae]|nr:CoA transferase [Actinomadura madurae]MCP9981067.1 CoA transferase [Actinomadura madurae]MCQ0017259.1 CoA transferase [Actinomadura madurae]